MASWCGLRGSGRPTAERQRPSRARRSSDRSVSKPLTATAVALLYEQGTLDLDAPVQRYVPSFPDKGYPISTRQLAGHSRIRHYKDARVVSNRHYASVLDGLRSRHSLLFPPGTRFSYTSYAGIFVSAVWRARRETTSCTTISAARVSPARSDPHSP